jgi:hypothetical protein
MKDHYDFSAAEKGKYYRPIEELDIPIFLDAEVRKQLTMIAASSGKDISSLVNELLNKDLEIIGTAKMTAE